MLAIRSVSGVCASARAGRGLTRYVRLTRSFRLSWPENQEAELRLRPRLRRLGWRQAGPGSARAHLISGLPRALGARQRDTCWEMAVCTMGNVFRMPAPAAWRHACRECMVLSVQRVRDRGGHRIEIDHTLRVRPPCARPAFQLRQRLAPSLLLRIMPAQERLRTSWGVQKCLSAVDTYRRARILKQRIDISLSSSSPPPPPPSTHQTQTHPTEDSSCREPPLVTRQCTH